MRFYQGVLPFGKGGFDLARTDMIVVGLILMLVVAPVLGFMGLLTIFFGGILLFPLAWVSGIVGFILLIVGLVSPSEIERAALARPPVVITQPAQASATTSTPSPDSSARHEENRRAAEDAEKEQRPGKWTPRNVVIVVIVITAIVIGSSFGAFFIWQAIRQPEIHVRDFNASLGNCGWFTSDQSVYVDSFRLANTGSAAGYIDIAITVDGNIVRTYTFLVLPDEDRVFYPSEDPLHTFSPSDETIRLQGCDAQVVSYVVGNIWKA